MKKTGDYLGSPADLDGVVSVTPQPVAERRSESSP